MAFGNFLVWTLGYYLSWRMTAYLLIIPPVFQLILLMPFPETAYWLVEDGKAEEAKKSLQFFR